MRIKRNWYDFYERLTPGNRKQFRQNCMSLYGYKNRSSVYALLGGSKAMTPAEEDQMLQLFSDLYLSQIASVAEHTYVPEEVALQN